jgi:spore coat protein H
MHGWPYRIALMAMLIGPACAIEEPDDLPATAPPPPPEIQSSTRCEVEAKPHADLELPTWDLIVELDDWDALHDDVHASVEVDASACIEGELYPIELELQGNSTRTLPKRSFDLKFNRGKRLAGSPYSDGEEPYDDGIGKILMKAMFYDQSLIREALAFDLFRVMGGEAPRIGFANLRINGAYWGLYVLVEPINEDYLLRHGYPPRGQLYKATRKHGGLADFEPGRRLSLAFESKELDDWDDDSDDDNDHEDEGAGEEDEEPHKDRSDLERLVHTLQRTPLTDAAFEADIEPIFPLAAYFERLIWVAWTQNGDGTAQNYYLYNAPYEGRDYWYQMPWDSNLCFGADWRDQDAVRSPEASLLLDGRNHFGERLVQVPGVRDRYVARFRDVLDDVLTPDVVFERFEHYSRLVEHDLAIDQQRWRRNTDPSTAFDALVEFFMARPDALRKGLDRLQAQGDAEQM